MPNNPDGGSALDDFLDEVVFYRGYPVTRGSAFLIEDELAPNNISQQLWVGRHETQAQVAEHAMPIEHARALIFRELERYHNFANVNFTL